MACTVYATSGLVWPIQSFPTASFPRWKSPRALREAKQAWEFFELVESSDAATRVRLSGTVWLNIINVGPRNSIWYPIDNQADLILYKNGQNLHYQACPSYSWVSQRDLGVSLDPLSNIFPASRAISRQIPDIPAPETPVTTTGPVPTNPVASIPKTPAASIPKTAAASITKTAAASITKTAAASITKTPAASIPTNPAASIPTNPAAPASKPVPAPTPTVTEPKKTRFANVMEDDSVAPPKKPSLQNIQKKKLLDQMAPQTQPNIPKAAPKASVASQPPVRKVVTDSGDPVLVNPKLIEEAKKTIETSTEKKEVKKETVETSTEKKEVKKEKSTEAQKDQAEQAEKPTEKKEVKEETGEKEKSTAAQKVQAEKPTEKTEIHAANSAEVKEDIIQHI